jgi:hypothetical protein
MTIPAARSTSGERHIDCSASGPGSDFHGKAYATVGQHMGCGSIQNLNSECGWFESKEPVRDLLRVCA